VRPALLITINQVYNSI